MNTQVSRQHVEGPALRHARLWAFVALVLVAVGLSLGLLLTRGGVPPISPPASIAPTQGVLHEGGGGIVSQPAEAPNTFRIDDRRFGEDVEAGSNPSAEPRIDSPSGPHGPQGPAGEPAYDCRYQIGP